MCDMCSSPEAVYRIELEGTRLNVCEKCSSYGNILGRIKQEEPEAPKSGKHKGFGFEAGRQETEAKSAKETETVQLIAEAYPKLIKDAREGLGLKQEELGKKIAERESVIHKLESGHLKPGLPLARKLEKFLRIKLIEEVEIENTGISKGATEGGSLTIGDMIKKKK